MSEAQLQADVLRYLASRGLFVWRNNTGSVSGIVASIERALIKALPYCARVITLILAPFKRGIDFGLPGSADVLVILPPDGRFLAIECKSPSGVQSEKQRRYQAAVERSGGLYILARSVDDVRRRIE